MKRQIFTFLILLSFLALPALSVFGGAPIVPGPEPTTPQNLPNRSAFDVAQSLANWIFTILLVIAVIAILIGAFYFVTAGGDAERIGTARSLVLYAVIGIIVAGFAWGLVSLARRLIEG